MGVWLKRIGIAIAAIVGLAVVLVLVLNVISIARQGKRYAIPATSIVVRTDSTSLARGRHIVAAVGLCGECHGADLGGKKFSEDLLTGTLYSSNLTRGKGGFPADYSDEDLWRALRHGVGRDGRSLVFMPSESFQELTQADLLSIIAYLHTVPPVDRERPATRPGPLMRVLHVAVGFPLLPAEKIDHAKAPVASVALGPTLEYGQYIGAACRGCHGPALAGGAGPGPNITRGVIGSWSEADFFCAIREGLRPDGTSLTDQMPWKGFRNMSDDELRALWLYLQSVPAVVPKKS